MSDQPLQCPHCDRSFSNANDRWQHARAKHGNRAARRLRSARDNEPSMGELVAEAHWNDDPSLDWVRDMFEVRPSRRYGS